MRQYLVLCGRFECLTRTLVQPSGEAGQFFSVDESELVDGEVWYCPACRVLLEEAS